MSRSDNKNKVIGSLSHELCHKKTSQDYMSEKNLRQAYRAYYHEQTVQKARSIMGEVLQIPSVRELLGGLPVIRIADLGTGTGGFAHGIIDIILESDLRSIHLSLQDRSAEVLAEAAREISEEFPALQSSIKLYQGVLPGTFPSLSAMNILSWGNLLTEWNWTLGLSRKLLAQIDHSLAINGLLIISEPADRLSSRRLHQFSSDLLQFLPSYSILAPCPNNRRSPCPALNNEQDWCHEDRPYTYSIELQKIAKELGHIKDSLKMSYLVCQKKSSPEEASKKTFQAPDLLTFKMISEMSHERGLSRSTFCDGSNWTSYRLLTRHKSFENDAFFRLKKGQKASMIFSSSPVEKGRNFDIPPGSGIVSSPHKSGPDSPGSEKPENK